MHREHPSRARVDGTLAGGLDEAGRDGELVHAWLLGVRLEQSEDPFGDGESILLFLTGGSGRRTQLADHRHRLPALNAFRVSTSAERWLSKPDLATYTAISARAGSASATSLTARNRLPKPSSSHPRPIRPRIL